VLDAEIEREPVRRRAARCARRRELAVDRALGGCSAARSTRVARGGSRSVRSSKRRSSSQTVPLPPGGARSRSRSRRGRAAAAARRSPANVTSLLRNAQRLPFGRERERIRCHHHTLRLVGSISFSSSLLAGAAPRTRSASAQLSGIRAREQTPRHDEASAALEVEVESQRVAVRARFAGRWSSA
jgi:hypothetical protein